MGILPAPAPSRFPSIVLDTLCLIPSHSVFALMGMLSPASRGSLTSAAVFLFCFMGLIAGYHAGRLYKTLKGRNPIRCAIQVCLIKSEISSFSIQFICSKFIRKYVSHLL